MFGFTPMRRSVHLVEQCQMEFRGRVHRAAAGDGVIYEDLNVCADRYPALTVRYRRDVRATVQKPNGLLVRDCMAWVDGTTLKVDSTAVAQVADSRKLMCGIQKKICIWPDKVIFDRETGELTPMEASWSGEGVFQDGTYAGEFALANTIIIDGDQRALFRAGDGVTVVMEGTTHGAYVIQEIEFSDTGGYTALRFLENTWEDFVFGEVNTGGEDGLQPLPRPGLGRQMTIRRSAPDLEGVFEHHNRLWGWHGQTIVCCKLGDPTNWQVFDGLSTDSWELVTGSPGDITGGCSFGGRPMFFKENEIIKLYGDDPRQFSTYSDQSLGVEKGSGQSLAVAGDTLFYKSIDGIMAYGGGHPWSVAEDFGGVRYRNAVAGADGVKYYVSMEDEAGEWHIFTYDTRHRVWHREDGWRMLAAGFDGKLYAMREVPSENYPQGSVLILGEAPKVQDLYERNIRSMVEFADYCDHTTRKKGLEKLLLRLEVGTGTTLDIQVQYDSDGQWHTVRQVMGQAVKGQIEVPLVIRRCDHYRIRLEALSRGDDGWTLYALTRTRYTGSNRK